MSAKAVFWAFDQRGLKPNEKLVLLTLANFANEKDECWPSYSRIADDACVSRRSVIEVIKRLIKRGFLRRFTRKNDIGDQTSNLFKLNVRANVEQVITDQGGEDDSLPSEVCAENRGEIVQGGGAGISPPSEVEDIEPSASASPGSAGDSPPSAGDSLGVVQEIHWGSAGASPGSAPRSPKPTNEPTIEPNITEPTKRTMSTHVDPDGQKNQSKKSIVFDLFEYWVQIMMKDPSSTKLTPKRERAISDRLKDYSPNQIKQAILNCSQDPFSMGANDRHKPYNDIELICRSGEKLESFLQGQVVSQPRQYSDVTARNIENLQGWA